MGKVMSVALAKAQRFNVENRAHRIISMDKPKAAPKFESNLIDLERVLKGENNLLSNQWSMNDIYIFQTTQRLLSKPVRRILN